LVFDRGNGTAHNPSTVVAAFKKLCARAGVPVLRFHDLRHTYATLSLGLGVHPKVVQERLGHSSIAMTLDRYSHVSMNMQATAAEVLESALGGRDHVVTKAG
jgi:integrase